jgi:putative tryptophan/tyrosine transport system substrate-binding protein
MLDFPGKGWSMQRRHFIALIGGAAASWPLVAIAQEPGRTYRLGMLWPFPRKTGSATDNVINAFVDEMRRAGFIEGENLTIDYRAWARHVDLISDYAVELVKTKVDVFAAGGDLAIRAAQHATKTTPILAITDDMVGSGLVSSMARPNGNTTGISILATELDGKRQQLLTDALPGLHRMAALADSNTTSAAQLDALHDAARARDIELSIHRIARPEEIAAAIDMAKASGATGINVLASPMLQTNSQIIMDRVAALRLPAIYQWPEMAEDGGFAAYGPRFAHLARDLFARQLIQLFHGAKVADIPVEQPTKFELVINLKTAKTLGVTVPPSLLTQADQVIE